MAGRAFLILMDEMFEAKRRREVAEVALARVEKSFVIAQDNVERAKADEKGFHCTVQGEPTRDSEEHLRGRWSNGDPVHIITDGSNRHVAPNLNGATWIPGAVEPYDRYAEHDRAKREGGYCRGCDEKFPAPQGEPSDKVLDEVRKHAERWADRPPTSAYGMGLRDAWRTILNKIETLTKASE